MGSISDGIEAACWSPDQEILVLMAKDGTVLLMTPDFDPLKEFKVGAETTQFVSVGWGKKETQFHGTQGKHRNTY